MNTKTCNKCGWIYPITAPGTKCKICGEPFEIVVCSKCGKVVSGKDRVPSRALCKVCHNAEERVHMIYYRERVNKSLDEQFNDWLSRIRNVPKDYPTLTEEQWMKACRYFNGCAKCGDESIDARGFFISFKNGGRYCDWNIIPLCSKCAADWSLDKNPFKLAMQRDHAARDYARRDCIKEITKYLGDILDGIK